MGSARAGVCAFKSSRTWTEPSKKWQSEKKEREFLIHRKELILFLFCPTGAGGGWNENEVELLCPLSKKKKKGCAET